MFGVRWLLARRFGEGAARNEPESGSGLKLP
jgi:hypothetical protein